MLKLAISKGRVSKIALSILSKAGYEFAQEQLGSRKLIIEDESNTLSLMLVKASDIPTYVENGVADVGIVGKDVLLESSSDVYELLDLDFGKCRMCVCGPQGYVVDNNKELKVGSKYPVIAQKYFDSKMVNSKIINLQGSVELAPLLGLTDVIVDIVETGKTLEENNLVVLDTIVEISSRLIANKASLKTKSEEMSRFIEKLEKTVGDK